MYLLCSYVVQRNIGQCLVKLPKIPSPLSYIVPDLDFYGFEGSLIMAYRPGAETILDYDKNKNKKIARF
jgi:hypothetical protein